MSKKLKIAAAGLGRMGKRHALNFLNRTPRAELVAAFSPDQEELAWGKLNLEPYGVTLYDDYQKMLEHPGLNAVVIGTATSVHAEEAIQAMRKDLHVLCEKPLSTNINVVSAHFSTRHRLYFANARTVSRCSRRGQEETAPKSHVRLLSPIRCLVSRRTQQDGARTHWTTIHHPQSDLR